MIDGAWKRDQKVETSARGAFIRPASRFRDRIEPGGRFAPEGGRYHLYVSLACPWAHRTLIFRKLKGLESMIGLSVTHWRMAEEGWTFDPSDGVIADPAGAHALHEIYARADPHYSGPVTVP